MYEIIRPTTKEIAYGVLIVCVLLVGVFLAGYLYGLREDVPNNGDGIGNIGEQYNQIKDDQHEITVGIGEAVGTSQDIAGTSQAIEGTVNSIADGLRESGKLLDDCQQLIGQIRNRGQKGKAEN